MGMFDGLAGASNPYSMDFAKLAQLNQYNQINLQNAGPSPLETIKQKLTSLSQEELSALMGIESFVIPYQTYQQGLQEYVLGKFANEYVTTDKGRNEIETLQKGLDSNIDHIRRQAQTEKEELLKLSKLLKENPDLLKQINKDNND